MADVKNFDKSRRTHWRSDDELERIHANLPWNRKTPVKWGLVAVALIGAGAVTQLVIWETQKVEARSALLSTVAPGTVFAGCDEVRARALAPLRRASRAMASIWTAMVTARRVSLMWGWSVQAILKSDPIIVDR